MSDNWVVQNLENALNTWNEKLAEIWQLITQSPQQFKGGAIWGVIVDIHGALQAIGLALLVLFFVVGVMKTCGSFAEVKRPEHALKLFIRFALAKGAVTYGMELMLALFEIIQGVISTIMQSAGFGAAQQTVLPGEIVTAVEECGFFESIPLWAVTLIGGLFITVLSFIMILTVYALANKGSDALNIHMCFYGNPGTGKTEVARIIAGILYEAKILPTKKVVEVDRGGLVGQYVGETPQKTMHAIERAMGGVLFIDEAYALIPKDGGAWDYGQEAVATLIKAMEDYRGKFCVILAGYKNQMMEMLSSNPGFVSRIQFELDFPNYDRGELEQITRFMLQKRKYRERLVQALEEY